MKYWLVLEDAVGLKRLLYLSPFGIVAGIQQWLIEEKFIWASKIPHEIWTVVPLLMLLWWVLKYAAGLNLKIEPKLRFTKVYEEQDLDDPDITRIYIWIKNISVSENLKDCLVRVEEVLDEKGNAFPTGFATPFPLKTQHQVGGRPPGRFNLDAEMEKKILL